MGDSVAIDGCCLTVVEIDDGALEFDAVAETLRGRRSATSARRPGERRAGDADGRPPRRPLGAGPRRRRGRGDRRRARRRRRPGDVRGARGRARYAIEKGSMCVAGVSLTVTAFDDDGFSVALIPHTRAVTTLGRARRRGSRVNLEADLVGQVRREAGRQAALLPSDAAVMTAEPSICEAYPDLDASRRSPPSRRRSRRSRRGPDGGGGRLARPRERGRPRDGRPARHARGDQLHGHATPAG